MCEGCGCTGTDTGIIIRKPGGLRIEDQYDSGLHDHDHRTLRLEQDVLAKNNRRAMENRNYFIANSILALNLVSSPGAGKTTLLEKTVVALSGMNIAVIEGDQQTMRDADRIQATGIEAVQVNTGTGCHLDADMVHRAMHKLTLKKNSLLFIENVGNLVCPALFDLGEAHKVVIISVTEGDDKPQKYPHMFHAADICVINKTDLLPYVQFDIGQCREYGLQVNPDLTFFELSATTGAGMTAWLDWLRQKVPGR